jgi:acetyl-CoA acyltransferase
VPVIRVEAACGSGGLALRQGFVEVASGMSDRVLVVGVEKMTDVDGPIATDVLAQAADQEYEVFHGINFAALNAMMARCHMERWGTTRTQLAQVAVKNHGNALHNPNAHFQMNVELEQVLSAQMVADPLGVLDCAPRSDGAAAVLLMSLEKAKELGIKPRARIRAQAVVGTDPVLMLEGPIPGTAAVLKKAGLDLKSIDLFEVNEAFASVVLAWEKETGADLNKTNVNGGAIAVGHPLGASGAILMNRLLFELERRDLRYGLETMCCGGGIGTATIIDRVVE